MDLTSCPFTSVHLMSATSSRDAYLLRVVYIRTFYFFLFWYGVTGWQILFMNDV
ncbi:uncharacterized protein BDW43DRAFT_200715 [Aspergillus alliaceus]|uniref:uncharacterized protein n=1 Tax=Petromyces alliaceus TaxID=209559 RepID=UPI0012A47586|nr:uncharacterized protein BDW43DRAFT_200715 [Aspergillus alliaceus]KAB8237132.1 hypothetical protein BDW43DRAFT_200715 [Aspergillus alliaceus]